MREPLTVVGGSVASLVLALTAARRGERVTLYVDPKRAGGSFGGIAVGERRFDLGSRLFELEYEGDGGKAVAGFDPETGNHRPYVRAVAELVREVLGEELCPAATPEMWIGGKRTRCVLMTVDLSELPAALPAAEREAVLEEVREILRRPVQVNAEEGTLEEASLAQHGRRLHELLTEAICGKQYPGWREVPARDRRKLWAALFHTRTVYEAFAGLPIGFAPHRPFATTRAGAAYPFAERLWAAVRAAAHVSVVEVGALTHVGLESGRRVCLHFGVVGGAEMAVRVAAERCVLGVAPEELFRAAGVEYRPERITSSIVWVDVAVEDVRCVPSTVMVCDPGSAVLRVSNAGRVPSWQSFAVEFGCGVPDDGTAMAVLEEMGMVAEGAAMRVAHRVTASVQVAPTVANRARFGVAGQAMSGFGGVLLGGARRFGFDSLNDQIVDGLYFGETLC